MNRYRLNIIALNLARKFRLQGRRRDFFATFRSVQEGRHLRMQWTGMHPPRDTAFEPPSYRYYRRDEYGHLPH